MLVLSRRAGDKIFIGKDIVVSIERISDGQVRIGIEAPKEVPIVRDNANTKVPAVPTGSD